ncbi:NOL1/NOP2/sun family putative RNA methylase [Natronocella acetinitrilica]|uniref:NOL1/NOP2/sun family putative RNA methylase n=1 Tax=Natronocella acetinitrilica TaxID=414046 RepID=A0AAE3KBT0_9GAMM|nr:RsmB/NOP family class I SAM-dependent RNA methyltransferase [Natronocella acetinitrilica]MCP1676040.1 NOL1/NOP2/sun family putative RNA methylase [Natronocella acetinitrilica]
MTRPLDPRARFPDREALAERIFSRYATIIDDADALFAALRRPLPQTLWANRLRISRERLAELLREDGLASTALPWWDQGLRLDAEARPGLHWGFFAGLFQVQEEVSMVPVTCLDPQPGDRVLDLCAAPGNKTAQIAVAMANRGTVVANDSSRGRIPAIRQTTKRLGLVNVSVTVRDGQGLHARAGGFDRVLVDAPCTCEGTFRKSRVPQIVADDVRQRTARIQQRLLTRAVSLTRPGGRIVYSTCTFSPEENEAVVDAVLRAHPGSLQVRPIRIPGLNHAPGLLHWGDQSFDPVLVGAARIWPHHNDSGGFFVVVLDKAATAPGPDEAAAFFRPAAAPDEWKQPFSERFGMSSAVWDGLQLVRRGGRHIHAISSDHQAPQAPAPDVLGLPMVRRKSLPLKPTTAAVLLLGHHASRNVVDLDAGQLGLYQRRETAVMEPDQLLRCSGPGHVIVRFRDQVIGLGQLIYDRETPTVWLHSFMPKAWGPVDAGSASGE